MGCLRLTDDVETSFLADAPLSVVYRTREVGQKAGCVLGEVCGNGQQNQGGGDIAFSINQEEEVVIDARKDDELKALALGLIVTPEPNSTVVGALILGAITTAALIHEIGLKHRSNTFKVADSDFNNSYPKPWTTSRGNPTNFPVGGPSGGGGNNWFRWLVGGAFGGGTAYLKYQHDKKIKRQKRQKREFKKDKTIVTEPKINPFRYEY